MTARLYLGQLNDLLERLSDYEENEGREIVRRCLQQLVEEVEARRDMLLADEYESEQQDGADDVVRTDDGRVKHKQNAEWIEKKTRKLRLNNPGEPKGYVREKAVEAYEAKFEKQIGKKTVRRYEHESV
jgi:hypothetical protein